MRRLLVLVLSMLAVPLAAQTVHEEMLVSTEWLRNHPEGATVIEIGNRAAYEVAHVPGAVLIETGELLTQLVGTPNELPSIEALEAVWTRAGAGKRGRIILYSRDPLLAARAWFTLDYLGHGRRAAILDGGFTRWADEGRPTSSAAPPVQTVPFHANVDVAVLTRLEAMKALVRYREIRGHSLVVIDARAAQQFRGEEPGSAVARAGHIPGAVNVPWSENLTGGVVPRFLPERELRELYASAGVNARSTNVLYCRTGVQASLTYFVLRYLGYDTTLYDGSYVEWSGDPAAAIAEVPPFGHGSPTKGDVDDTTQIPFSDWRRTLDDLSRSYDGALVSLEIVGGEVGAEEEVHDQPLRGITSDPSGITLQIEKRGGLHLGHRVAHPMKLRVVETRGGAVVAIEIEDHEGIHNLVRFRSPARRDMFDLAVE